MTMSTATWDPRAQYEPMSQDEANLTPKPKKRSFTAQYKRDILAEYEAQTGPGAKGALLRREGLYSSHIVEWKKARDNGALKGLASGTRSPKRSAEQRELERLRGRNQRLEDDLAKHKLVIEIQGKASELLEQLLTRSNEQTRQQP